MSADVRAYTIFADDIRFEMAGKQILIGCYGGDLVFPGPPPSPPLMLHALIRVYSGDVEKLALPSIRFVIGDEELALFAPPPIEAKGNLLSLNPINEWRKIPNFPLYINDIPLMQFSTAIPVPSRNESSILRVELSFDEVRVPAGGLVLRFAPQPQMAEAAEALAG